MSIVHSIDAKIYYFSDINVSLDFYSNFAVKDFHDFFICFGSTVSLIICICGIHLNLYYDDTINNEFLNCNFLLLEDYFKSSCFEPVSA